MKKLPFIFGKSSDSINFTDREEESLRLETNFKSLINTTIISPRRWGKTSLVENVAENIRKENKKIKVCMLDIFNVRSETEFYEHFAKGVLKGTSNQWEEMIENAKKFLSHLLPKITFSPDSQAEISFGVSWETLQKNPDEILNLPETIAKEKKISVIVCVDEFQAIGDFSESIAFQRKLRSHWQHHHNVGYCLYGSKRTMLLDIFSNASMPFYKFGDIMFLQKISNKKWGKFVNKRFEETGKKITIEQAEYLAELVDNHSYYVQQLAQQAWLCTKTSCSKTIIDESLQRIKNQLSLLFVGQIETMTSTQINFLNAVLDGETAFSSQENLKKYRFGSSANLKKIKDALISREIIDIYTQKVDILDPIFKLWLKEDFFKIKLY
ncbi:MAG: ATPase [Bacteroidales bacterium]|jgi:AAA+ ATPase superfamily predicted ATPase|nr:ATPase [Bacteroidales bacterium]